MLTPLNQQKNIFDVLGRHPVHPFPARMAPGIALDALAKRRRPLRVLDPMMGSGTVLAVARAKGHKAIGADLDPLAVLMAKVWTRSVDKKRTIKKSKKVLARAKSLFKDLPQARAYPQRTDKETRRFIRYWFDVYARKQLASLALVISRVRDRQVRDVLWCSFSRLIITKNAGASLAMDLSHSRPHREYTQAPIKPFNRFIPTVEAVVSNCLVRGTASGPAPMATCGDARKLDLDDSSIDLVLTSPPYLNAIDYIRCSKFSLVWMGHTTSELRKIRGEGVGAELACSEATKSQITKDVIKELQLTPQLSDRNQAILAHYVWDMHKALGETARVLKSQGRAIYVVGDSTVRGTFIRNSDIISAVAQRQGLRLLSKHSRALPANRRYLPPPQVRKGSALLNSRMRREVILVFVKLRSNRRG